MKAKCLVIIWLLGFLSVVSCNATDLNPVKNLQIQNPQIIEELKKICEQRSGLCRLNKHVFIMGVKQINDSCELRIAPIHEDDITLYLKDKVTKLVGYFEFENEPVFVFGDIVEGLFKVTEESKSFNYLNIKPPKLKKGTYPTTFEPQVWVYRVENGEIVLKETGLYWILE